MNAPGSPASFGPPHQTADGATVITLSRPVGVFVVRDGGAVWTPARDDTKVALFGVAVGMVATILVGIAVVIRPPWPDLHGYPRRP